MEIIFLVLICVVIVLQIILLFKPNRPKEVIKHLDANFDHMQRFVDEQMKNNREEFSCNSRLNREELTSSVRGLNDSVLARIADLAQISSSQMDNFTGQLGKLTQSNEQKLENMRETVEKQLSLIQNDNAHKLEQIRGVVEEKLQTTLEKRLGESFRLVSERLELVHQGLGEMQNLAVGVGDLKRVFTNVKTRGILGEIQLGNIIEDILTPEQYAKNVATKKGSAERVEYAIKIPAKDDGERVIWLPIDAKFPVEDYQRLLDAREKGEKDLQQFAKALNNRVKQEAKSIKEKYLAPPETTDFALLFLPTEGLYAQVLNQNGLFEEIQREYKVILSGPTTLAALIHSLQIGFRTLNIEKRSGEIWALLGAVKTEFSRFSHLLERTQQKLAEASHSIDDAARKSKTIERRLKKVQETPSNTADVRLISEIVEEIF